MCCPAVITVVPTFPEAESVTPEERDQMFALCSQIAEEKDPQKFSTLVQKLNELLESKELRLDDVPNKQ